MPGAVMMDSGASHLQSTNHDRNNGSFANGVRETPNGVAAHGDESTASGAHSALNGSQTPISAASRMNDLPDEIQHITQGFVPLGVFLSRLAQQTHNQLGDEIAALAKMPMPSSAMNGNLATSDAFMDDNSPENLNKKVRLLSFVQERHGEWVKALVIANWSRKAEPVSKLIDLMHHIQKTRAYYQGSLDYMINIKRDLTYARIPTPDLRTALQVLSTGQAPWMPELHYIQPPQIPAEDKLRWIENHNTLLSIRLNLDEYEKIPQQFQDFDINVGRVTFKVPGEFEVDLTIVDDDPEKQFYFIDFRFAFRPAPSELSAPLREFIDLKVNEALLNDGLLGCYKVLHEFVLTHKMTEYVRQAVELNRRRWANMLQVERLRRAMSIRYWSGRHPSDGPQSYFILGVASGKGPGSVPAPDSSTYLRLRWFRDGVEVKDAQFPLDEKVVSTEAILNRVVGKHIEHILRTFHTTLESQGRFLRREAVLGFNIVDGHPGESTLRIQLDHNQALSIKVALLTGMLLTSPQSLPQSRGTFDLQSQLNKDAKRPVMEHVALLERFRCSYIEDKLKRFGVSRGWSVCNPHPVKFEETRPLIGTRGSHQLIWLKRHGLPDNWYIMVDQSLGGDTWWLIEVITSSGSAKIATHACLPLSPSTPPLSDKFLADLTFFSSTMMSQIGILGAMHREKIKYAVQNLKNTTLPSGMKVPSIYVKLSEIIGRQHSHVIKSISSWAYDFVAINLKSIVNRTAKPQEPPKTLGMQGDDQNAAPMQAEQHRYVMVVDARVKVADPTRFGPLKGNVERDVAFNERLGVFSFLVEAEVGSSILDILAHRLQALSRLANSIDAIRRSDRDVQCEEITLSTVKFSYTDQARSTNAEIRQNTHRWTASLDLQTDDVKLRFDSGNPQIRLVEQLDRLINSTDGFRGVPWFLSMTLPLQRALDVVEHAWEATNMKGRCCVKVSVLTLDWYTIQYILSPGKTKSKHLTLSIRLQSHSGQSEWHIYREEPGQEKQPDDEAQRVLQKVWASEKRMWRQLGGNVVVDAVKGLEALVKAMDDAVRALAVSSPAVPKQAQPKPAAPRNGAQNQGAAANRPRPQQPGVAGRVVISLDD
ncbi:mediator complex subunit MED14 [Astrocystis sublimbata]|nr:mediator complex subunit MED14 [Astrocystis sublimbata]